MNTRDHRTRGTIKPDYTHCHKDYTNCNNLPLSISIKTTNFSR